MLELQLAKEMVCAWPRWLVERVLTSEIMPLIDGRKASSLAFMWLLYLVKSMLLMKDLGVRWNTKREGELVFL